MNCLTQDDISLSDVRQRSDSLGRVLNLASWLKSRRQLICVRFWLKADIARESVHRRVQCKWPPNQTCVRAGSSSAFDGIRAESRVFVTDFLRGLEVG